MENLTDAQNIIIDQSLETFHTAMVTAGQLAWGQIEPLLEIMDEVDGKLISTEFNNQVINEVNQIMYAGYESGMYTNGIDQMRDSLEDLRVMTKEYYEDNFGELPQAYESMTKGLVTTIGKTDFNTYFGDAAFQNDVMQFTSNKIYNHISTSSTKMAMISDMEHWVEDRFYTFSVTRSLTLMEQFIRRLNEIFASYFELVWCKYEGPLDEITREFCADRINEGPFYHREEVKTWADQYAPWGGMIPNTDRGSIFVNLGGYNCRHALVYVEASSVPEGDKQRAKDRGFI